MCILKILIANRRCKCCACRQHTLQRATSISRRHQGAKCECQMHLLLTSLLPPCLVASLRRCASVYDLENFSSSHWIYRLTARRCYDLFSLRRLEASPPPPTVCTVFALGRLPVGLTSHLLRFCGQWQPFCFFSAAIAAVSKHIIRRTWRSLLQAFFCVCVYARFAAECLLSIMSGQSLEYPVVMRRV